MPVSIELLQKLTQVKNLPDYKFQNIGTWNNVLIVEGERSDSERLLKWLQLQDELLLFNMVAVWSWKGGVSFVWKTIRHPIIKTEEIEMPDGDIWTVYDQIIINTKLK